MSSFNGTGYYMVFKKPYFLVPSINILIIVIFFLLTRLGKGEEAYYIEMILIMVAALFPVFNLNIGFILGIIYWFKAWRGRQNEKLLHWCLAFLLWGGVLVALCEILLSGKYLPAIFVLRSSLWL